MALDDFDTHESAEAQAAKPIVAPVAAAKKHAGGEDEDLFDFPVVEMKFESDKDKKPAATSAPAAAPAPAAAAPAPAPAAGKPAEAAPAAKSATPAAPAQAKAPAPAAAAAPAKPAAGKEPAKGAEKSEKKDVAQAAQLVEDIETALGSEGKSGKRGRRVQGPAPLTLVGIGVLLITNVFGLFFLWRTTESFQSGVQTMNQQFVEALRRQTLVQGTVEAAPTTQHGSEAGAHGNEGAHGSPVPLEASEKTAIQLAREEIDAGEYAAARRRLSRLLAVADRIDPERREEIEAEASFLIADTYRKQAASAEERKP